MDLLGMLRKLGDRLGVIELAADSQHPSAPVKIQTRTVTLDELIAVHLKPVQDLAEQHTEEFPATFEDVFNAAGIRTPQNGWTVDRLREFLGSDRLRNLDRANVQRQILEQLAQQRVDAADIVKDAISRDQALDAFAEFTAKKRERWLAQRRDEIRNLEHEIVENERKWKEWRALKRQRELEMARAVEYLIDKPVISIDDL
jgi:hypothetical protein